MTCTCLARRAARAAQVLRKHLLVVFLAAAGLLITQPGFGQIRISSVTTSSQPVASSSYTVNGKTVNHGAPSPGDDLILTEFEAGSVIFSYERSADRVAVRRYDPPSGGPSGSPFGDKIAVWSQGTYGSNTAALPTERMYTVEEALSSRALNRGSNNTFDNARGATLSNNIERVDFIFDAGLSATADALSLAGFPIFERNGGNDFGIAAITSLDGSGEPDGYTPLLTVSNNTGTMVVPGFTYVELKQEDGGTLLEPFGQGSQQGIKGVFVRLSDLGLGAGQTFYGYSLFGEDVTTSHNLVDYPTFPKTETGGADLGGGGHFFALDGIMPVELVTFTATADGADVLLAWTTASETNNAGFEIQRISKMVETQHAATPVWEMLAFVEGWGTTLEAQRYAYRVPGLEPGVYRFRLRQVDYDGTFAYSPEVEVAVEMATAFVVEPAYPNPFNPEATLRFAVQRPQSVRADLFDGLGRRIRTLYEGNAAAGQVLNVPIDGRDLPSGVYLVRLVGERFAATQSVTLVK